MKEVTSKMKDPQRITLERTLAAPVEAVWRLWTTKEGIERWWGPEGFESEVKRIDVRVGGGYEIAMTAVREEIVEYLRSTGAPTTSYDKGDYSEVRQHSRLAWANAIDFVPGVDSYESRSSLDLRQDEEGRTHIVLTIDAMHDEHWTKMKRTGWEQQLKKLEGLFASAA